MKKNIYLFCIFGLLSLISRGQSAIPNGNFETWNSSAYDTPTGYFGSNPSTFFRCNSPFNCIKTSDSYHGSFAVQISTNANGTDTCMGYIVNSANPGNGNPCNWAGGLPYNQIPTGIRGYYKSNSVPGDSGGVLIAFKNAGSCLGLYMIKLGGVHNTYTPFQLNFNPPISGTPDTMLFAAVSSDIFNNIQKPGSMLQLDSLSFIGVSQSPSFNGDFENWQNQIVEKPANWAPLFSSDQSNGVGKTTDKFAGSYAVQMSTFAGDNNGVPRANSSGISTGYNLNNCSGPNCLKGGYPFSNQIDTLCFYYKYAPMGNDTAQAFVTFKKNGATVFNSGAFITAPAATYTYKEVPFNTGSSIDTVIVSFQSSSWRDTTLNYVGSTLKIDEVHFKSQPLNAGIKVFDPSNGIKIFPNPAVNGSFIISNVEYFDLVRVYDIFGQEVKSSVRKENGIARVQIDTPGAYTVLINAQGKSTLLKVLVGSE